MRRCKNVILSVGLNQASPLNRFWSWYETRVAAIMVAHKQDKECDATTTQYRPTFPTKEEMRWQSMCKYAAKI